MRKKILTQFAGLLLFSTVAFSQQYNQEYLDSLVQNKVQPLVSRGTKFV